MFEVGKDSGKRHRLPSYAETGDKERPMCCSNDCLLAANRCSALAIVTKVWNELVRDKVVVLDTVGIVPHRVDCGEFLKGFTLRMRGFPNF